MHRQMREVGERHACRADIAGEMIDLLVRQLEEFIDQAEFVHQLERRGMHDIAAEIAQEVGVLFENGDRDAGARQQKAEHHAGRPAAGHAARRFDRGFHS